MLSRFAVDRLTEAGVVASLIDLQDHPLPMCDAGVSYNHPSVEILSTAIQQAHAVVLGVPIYNYYANAAVKNLIELTGESWNGKIVGFLCAAGGQGSYMSVMNLANSLMLDFRCLIVPRFVYATKNDFADGQITSDKIKNRITELTTTTAMLAEAVGGRLPS